MANICSQWLCGDDLSGTRMTDLSSKVFPSAGERSFESSAPFSVDGSAFIVREQMCVCLRSPCVTVCLHSPNPHRPRQNSCSNTSGPQPIAVWATATTAAPSVADSPHTAILTIRLPFPRSWPGSRGKAAS